MSEAFERPQDPYDRRLALGATGLLRAANAADVLTAADVHVATRMAQLAGESDDTVRLAVAMAVRGIRSGSVCIDLEQARATLLLADPDGSWPELPGWRDVVRASPLVGEASAAAMGVRPALSGPVPARRSSRSATTCWPAARSRRRRSTGPRCPRAGPAVRRW